MLRKRRKSLRLNNSLRYRKSFLEPLEDRRLLTANFGDAPEPYPVTVAEDGARHLATGPRLGDLRGATSNGQHSFEATGDIDDDGVEIGGIRAGQLNSTIIVNVQNAPAGAKLDAWIDFDHDGSWGGSQEIIASGVSVDEGTNIIEFDVPANSVAGTTFARFRLSTEGNLGIFGEAADGEVEDYRIIISAAARGSATFSNAQPISTQALGAFSIATADINGDGNLDVVSAAGNGQQVAWYENNGEESFTQHVVSTAATGRSYVATADLDGDGDIDILSSSMEDNALRWYRNDGAEGFATSLIGTAGGRLHGLNIVDLDNDGDLDVLAANYDGGSVVLFENDGAEEFHVSTIGDGARMVRGITSGDLDNDGDIDIVVGSEEGPKLRWFENNGDEVFVGHDISNTGDRAMSVAIADVDRDGDADLVAVYRGDDKVAWYENDGSQAFTERVIATNADNVHGLYVGDVDGDGDVDVVSASNGDQKVALYQNDGSQNFAVSVVASDLPETYAVIVDDLDGDHKLDILSASYDDNKIVWYEQEGGSIVGTVFEDLDTDGVRKITHFETFDSDPNWVSAGDGVSGNDFGFKQSSIAGGTAGELGGKFTRSSVPMRLADEFDEPLEFGKSILASGSLGIGDFNCPDLGNTFFLGHGIVDQQGEFTSGIGIRFTDNSDCTNLYPLLTVLTTNPHNEYGPANYDFNDHAFEKNSQLEWQYMWEPDLGDFGTVEYLLNEVPYSIPLTEEARTFFNSNPSSFFGFAGMGGNNAFNSSKFAELFIDDVRYTSVHRTEPGIEEIDVLLDANLNGVWDAGEHITQTLSDDATTEDFDEDGRFSFGAVQPGLHYVRLGVDDRFEFPFFTPTFGNYADSAAGNVHGVSAADLDNDGDMDFISVDLGSNTTIHLNQGNGQFTTQSVNTGNKSVSTALGDLDNDGDIDAIVSVENESRLAILENDGSGGFSLERHVDVGSRPRGIDVGDINNDGLLDIVVANQTSNSVSILVNQDSLSFSKQDLAVGEFPTYVRLGDIDNDSDLDLAVTHQLSDDLRVYKNQGGVSFSSISVLNEGSAPNNLQYIDYDLDNDLDIVTTHPNDNRIRIWPNDDGFSSSAVTSYSVGTFPDGVEVHDINLDGRPDIVTANRDSNDLSVLLNLGGGSFENNAFAIGQRPIYVDVADFNGDGWPDLLAGASGDTKAKIGISSGWVTTALVQDGETTRVDLPLMRKPTGSLSGHVFEDVNRDGEWHGQRTANFDADPGWTGNLNRTNSYDYGYTATNHVDSDSSPGEIGGRLVRSSQASYYADLELGTTLTLDNPLVAKGDIKLENININGMVNVGYLNSDTADQLQFALLESNEQAGNVRAVVYLTTGNGQVYTSAPILLSNAQETVREWSLQYTRDDTTLNGTAVLSISGAGALSSNGVGGTTVLDTVREVGADGSTVTMTIPANVTNENASFNGFGISSPALNSPNNALSIDLYLDNLSYTAGHEEGVAGVEVYLDANQNYEFDEGELSTATAVDDVSTLEVNEAGHYSFPDLLPGVYQVNLVEAGRSVSRYLGASPTLVPIKKGADVGNVQLGVFNEVPTLDVDLFVPIFSDDFDSDTASGNASLNKWDITGGSIDVFTVANQFKEFGWQDSNQHLVDLDGSSSNGAKITTKEQLNLEPGIYELSFEVSGPLRWEGGEDTFGFGLEGIFSESLTLATKALMREVRHSFVISDTADSRIFFDHDSAGDNYGIIIDNVELSRSGMIIDEDAGQQTVNLAGITAGGGETQARRVTATSSNTDLIADVLTESLSAEGLVAYYPLNGNASDGSGNSNNGMAHGAITTVDRFGRADNAYLLSDSYIAFDIPELPQSDASRTLSVWTRADVSDETTDVIAQWGDDEPNEGFGLFIHDDEFQGGTYGHENDIKSGVAVDDQWHHLVLTLTGDSLAIYVDGEFRGSKTVVAETAGTTLMLGKEVNNTDADEKAYTGAIDDVRVYNRSLSASEVGKLFRSESGQSKVSFTPLADQHGTTTITVTVEDAGLDNDLATTEDNLSTSKSFNVTVSPVNDDPTLDPIADLTIDEDAGLQTVDLTGISAGGGETQALRVTATSSNTDLIAGVVTEAISEVDLVAHYTFSSNADDSSGYSNDGVVSGAVLIDDRFGNPDSSYYFDGVDDYIQVADHPSLRPEDAITVSLWVNWEFREGRELHDRILSKNSPEVQDGPGAYQILTGNEVMDEYGEIGFYITTTEGTKFVYENDKVDNSDTYLPHDQWHQVTATYDGSTVSVYHDGVLAYEASHTGALSHTTDPLYFGKDQEQGLYFKGAIDDVRIYGRALSSDEVHQLHQIESGQAQLTFTPEPDQHGSTTITVTVEDGGLDNDLDTDFEFRAGAQYDGDDLRDIVTVDLDHDGDLDFISASYTTDRLSVRLNDGSGQFGNPVYYDSLDTAAGGIAIADFNGDGHMDLVVSGERQSGKIVLHPGNGTGGFGDRYEYAFDATGGRPLGITAQDVTGDGVPDVALVDNYRDKLFILPYNRTTGTFANSQEITTGHQPDQTAVTDIDRDGDYDLIVGCTNGGGVGSIQVYTNNGTGTFALDHQVSQVSTPNAFVVGDINNDGHDDVITSAVRVDKLIYVLLNDGNGTIAKSQTLPLANDTNHNQLELVDYNLDGWLDLAIVEGESNKLKVYQNKEGFFSLTSELTTGLLPVSVHKADVDGDGDPDLLVGHKASDQHHEASNTIRMVENLWEQANATMTRTFDVTVNPVNDAPTLDSLADVTIDEDSPEQTVNLAGISAGGGEVQPMLVSASSSNSSLIGQVTVDYSPINTTGTLKFTPLADQHGVSTITVTVEDGGLDNDLATSEDNATFSQTFDVTVNPVNTAPTLDEITDVTIDEDSPEQTVNLAGITSGGGESQALRVTATSSNTTLIADPAVSYTSANPAGSVTFAPFADQHGTSTITVTVEDGGLDGDLDTAGDNATFSRTFDVTVSPVNDLPTLDGLADLTIDEDASEQTVNLAGISAGGGETQPLRVTATSSNTALIADPTVSYTSENPTGTVSLTPQSGKYGSSTISVTVEDGGLDNDLATSEDNASVNTTFDVTVNRGNFWHNDSLPEDVNADGFVSALDALLIINQLNESGASEVPRNRPTDSPMVDVNDDQWVSPQDAIHIINVLNNRNHLVSIDLHVSDLAGNRIKRLDQGASFYLVFTTEDLRDDSQGVFAAYADVYYGSAHVTIEEGLQFTAPFTNGQAGDLTTPGKFDEWGAFAGLSETGSGELEVGRVLMRAVKSGTAVFGTSAADESPAHDVLVYGTTDTIDHHEIDFSGLQLIIDEVEVGEGEFQSVDETLLDQVSAREETDLLELDQFFGQF